MRSSYALKLKFKIQMLRLFGHAWWQQTYEIIKLQCVKKNVHTLRTTSTSNDSYVDMSEQCAYYS